MMRLSVSNLAWPRDIEPALLPELCRLGVNGVEVAPTRLAQWEDLAPSQLRDYQHRLADNGLVVSSMQAILYGKNDLLLLGSDASFRDLADHMRRVADMAAVLGAEALVFGSPRNRLRGELPLDQAWAMARDRWHQLGSIVASAGAVIGIEPVPSYYGGDFLTGWKDVLRMVQEVDHLGVRVHLDTGCVALGGDSIVDAIPACMPWLTHFHAAQPDLASFEVPAESHAVAGQALHDGGYARWVAIEMREQQAADQAVIEAVKAVTALYRLSPAQK